MIDASTNEPLSVSDDGDAGPYVMVPVQQLDHVLAVLDRVTIRYLVDEEAISLNGEPEITVVNLGRDVDAAYVQRILDGVK